MERIALAAAAAVFLLAGCTAPPISAPTESVTPAPAAAEASDPESPEASDPEPVYLEISGSYKDDMAAIGYTPDNDQEFEEFMTKQLCGYSGDSLGVGVRGLGGREPNGIKAVRLTVAYFCPEKTAEVEQYLEYFK